MQYEGPSPDIYINSHEALMTRRYIFTSSHEALRSRRYLLTSSHEALTHIAQKSI